MAAPRHEAARVCMELGAPWTQEVRCHGAHTGAQKRAALLRSVQELQRRLNTGLKSTQVPGAIQQQVAQVHDLGGSSKHWGQWGGNGVGLHM